VLIDALRGHTSILVGQSGVGKSSLINALLPDREVQVGRLSQATGLGRHTTSAATLYTLPHGGRLIDSPGVRSFRLSSPNRGELEQGFREFSPHLGKCRFHDCRHDREPECAIRSAVTAGEIHPDRLANFLHMAAAGGG
jgi:ribosome biogenesis GTPase